MTFGNYIPTAQLIGITGHVNPVGPIFFEFRCAVVIVAAAQPGGEEVIPVYGMWWTRDQDRSAEREMTTQKSDLGSKWVVNMPDPFSPPK